MGQQHSWSGVSLSDDSHHTDCFRHRAELIIWGLSVLLQEIFLDYLCELQYNLLLFWQRVFSYQLDEFLQLGFLLQNLSYDLSGLHLVRFLFGVILLQNLFIITEWFQPVDWREVLSLCQFLVETPEHLHDRQCLRCYRIIEVTSWRTHCTYDGNWPLSVWGSEAGHQTGSFLKLC